VPIRYNGSTVPRCPSCGGPLEAPALACPLCGAALDSSPTAPLDSDSPTFESSPAGPLDATLAQGAWTPGETVLGRYRIVRRIGHGGMGAVWEAEDLKLDQRVALKLILEEITADVRWAQRFRTEARLARQVTHPNVCRVYDIAEVRGRQFISMELVDGEDLESLLRRVGRLTTAKAIEVGRQVCAGLVWLFYVALEPYVRRFWPDSLVGWNRLWTGRLLDPMLARDVLVGTLVATAGNASTVLLAGALSRCDVFQRDLTPLLGTRFYLSAVVESLEDGIYIGLLFLLVLFLVRWRAGNRRLALVLSVALAAAAAVGIFASHSEGFRVDPITLASMVAWVVGEVLLLTRFGLLAATVASAIGVMAGQQPVTADLSAWYSGYTAAGVAIVLGLSIYGAIGSTGSLTPRPTKGGS
jgi:hypothetical protein